MLGLEEKFYNRVKWMLKNGEKTVGAWLQIGSPYTAEIFGKAGFDWVMIDMEHGPGDIQTLISQLQGLKGYGTVPFVRAPWNDFVVIKRILDAGVYGVLVPYVNTKEEAENAVKACKYPTKGIRGVAGSPRAGGYGMNMRNYLDNADEQIVVMTAIETPEAVANIDSILEVEDLDGIFIGPMDLATSMGYFCNPSAKEVQDAIKVIEEKVFKSGKFLGTVASDIDAAIKLYEKGYQYVVTMADGVSLGKMAVDNVKKFKETYKTQEVEMETLV